MSEEVNVQIKFTIEHKDYPSYTDALYFTIEDYNKLDLSEIESLKNARWEKWRDQIDTPPAPEPNDEL